MYTIELFVFQVHVEEKEKYNFHGLLNKGNGMFVHKKIFFFQNLRYTAYATEVVILVTILPFPTHTFCVTCCKQR